MVSTSMFALRDLIATKRWNFARDMLGGRRALINNPLKPSGSFRLGLVHLKTLSLRGFKSFASATTSSP